MNEPSGLKDLVEISGEFAWLKDVFSMESDVAGEAFRDAVIKWLEDNPIFSEWAKHAVGFLIVHISNPTEDDALEAAKNESIIRKEMLLMKMNDHEKWLARQTESLLSTLLTELKEKAEATA